MSWLEKLYLTYENNLGNIGNPNDVIPLLPLNHSSQGAQVHVVIDRGGNFLRAEVVPKENASTIIPVTEDSSGRSGSKNAPHGLFDSLQYVAGDYLSWGGNPNKKKNDSFFDQYITALKKWAQWSGNPKIKAVLTYLQQGQLIRDLVSHEVLLANDKGALAEQWDQKIDESTGEAAEEPAIFKAIRLGKKKGQFEAFVRFSVEIPGDPSAELWKDPEVWNSWIGYQGLFQNTIDMCMVTGKQASIARLHPKHIRFQGDGAKLISSNDTSGFTYLGRFTNDKEACCVGAEVTQKAHSALRWLIGRQAYKADEHVVLAWAVSGVDIPKIHQNSLEFIEGVQTDSDKPVDYTAEETGLALKKKIAGYAAKIKPVDDVVVMGLYAATPGCLSVNFYRELSGSDLLAKVQAWHEGCVWHQKYKESPAFIGAPSPSDIAKAAYGQNISGSLRKATVERLLHCIIDGVSIPRDLVDACFQRACNKIGSEDEREWEQTLGIACALFRNQNKERNYQMALEQDRNTRDYLFGRLFALAEHLEKRALTIGGEKRATNVEKSMQRFVEKPQSTWLNLESGLTPYKTRLSSKEPAFLYVINQKMDEVMAAFATDDFISDKRLTGEFLLAYHCQRADLAWKDKKDDGTKDDSDENVEA